MTTTTDLKNSSSVLAQAIARMTEALGSDAVLLDEIQVKDFHDPYEGEDAKSTSLPSWSSPPLSKKFKPWSGSPANFKSSSGHHPPDATTATVARPRCQRLRCLEPAPYE
ncbi:hypothetical protein NHF46_08270 [Arthrobacter alpinus]|nr:hypothetical protein [Arthrobacter alpinus]